nr:MAG TPA: hypothetical protein [Caudoviricetes sp.]
MFLTLLQNRSLNEATSSLLSISFDFYTSRIKSPPGIQPLYMYLAGFFEIGFGPSSQLHKTLQRVGSLYARP